MTAALQALYVGFKATVMFAGAVHDHLEIAVRRGLKQGCLASGSVRALLFDCIVRRVASPMPVWGVLPDLLH